MRDGTKGKRQEKTQEKINKTFCRHAEDLHYLHNASGRVQKAIIGDGRSSLVKVLVLLAGNILNGNIKLTAEQKQRLRKYARVIRELVYGSKNTEDRKRLLVRHTNQKGGFLGFLINPIANLIKPIVKG